MSIALQNPSFILRSLLLMSTIVLKFRGFQLQLEQEFDYLCLPEILEGYSSSR